MSFATSDRRLRILLAIVFVIAMAYQTGFTVGSINDLRAGSALPRQPLVFGFRLERISGVFPETERAGVHWGDTLEQVDGRPFTGTLMLSQAVAKRHAGDLLPVVVRRQDGTRLATEIRLASARQTTTASTWTLNLLVEVVLPLFCLALGFWVAAARPTDRVAWLLLALMLGFSQFVQGFSWPDWPFLSLALIWNELFGFGFGLWLVWLVLFGLLFPTRAALDRRYPGLKWLVLVPLITQTVFFFVFNLGRDYNLTALHPLRPVLDFLVRFPLYTYIGFLGIGSFFALIWIQGAFAATPDARRRLRILYFGTAASLTPMFIAAIVSVIRGDDVLYGLPQWAVITTLLALLLFPLTLAYVIVVQRAMAVGVVVRQGIKYALARRGLQVFRALVLAVAIWNLIGVFAHANSSLLSRSWAVVFLALVVVLRQRFYSRLSSWVDKRFFREAYSSEVVMSELAEQARHFTEAGPLLGTVVRRVSDTLHVSRIAVFVREEDRFCVTETLGIDPVPVACLSPEGRSVGVLTEATKPELVYFDDPRSWVHGAAPDEQQELRSLQTEVLLALPGRDELLGLVALGPKLSEEPYSPSDLKLLQSVAIQTGFALENTQLLATVAREAGQRERINRELEIAREVQERLFPQSCPAVPGLDYFGFCRPALAVGGDYYDYIPRADGKLGIALGDVSGKGISAALMMASLQSLLRGQIAAGLSDVAELITNTNRLLHDVSTANRYCTFFYGEYDPATRGMVYVNGGHNPPIVLRDDAVFRLEASGPVVGLLPNIRFDHATFQFQPGDVFLVFTDGYSEAMTDADEEWGDDRLVESARSHKQLPATAMARKILEDADRFTAGAEQHDDMTLIAVKVS